MLRHDPNDIARALHDLQQFRQQYDVDIKRLWRRAGELRGATGDYREPPPTTTTTTTTSTTTTTTTGTTTTTTGGGTTTTTAADTTTTTTAAATTTTTTEVCSGNCTYRPVTSNVSPTGFEWSLDSHDCTASCAACAVPDDTFHIIHGYPNSLAAPPLLVACTT